MRLPLLFARLAPFATFVVIAQIATLVTSALVAALVRSPVFAEYSDALAATTDTHAALDIAEQRALDTATEIAALATLIIPLVGLIASVTLAWCVSRAGQRVRVGVGITAAVVFVVSPLLARVFGDFTGVWSSAPERILAWMAVRIIIVTVAVIAVRSGVGSVATFGWRRALAQIRDMVPLTAKALPVTLLTFLFAFFSAETWQVASTLTLWGVFAVVAILVALAAILVVATTGERIDELVREGVPVPVIARVSREILTATAEDSDDVGEENLDSRHTDGEVVHVPVTRAQRANLIVVHALAHLWQAGMFALIVGVFLVGFCIVAIPSAVETKWTELMPHLITVNSVVLPVSVAYLKVSALLASVAALSFAGATATDDFYARHLRDELNREVEEALAASSLTPRNV